MNPRLAVQELLEVTDVPNLARLVDPQSCSVETGFLVKLEHLLGLLLLPAEEQVAADERASSALAGQTVNYDDVLGILQKELVHLPAELEEEVKRWGVVVVPLAAYDLAAELLEVVSSVREVYNQVVVLVLCLKEPNHLI